MDRPESDNLHERCSKHRLPKGCAVTTPQETEGMRVWRDDEGKLWTLADPDIDTEMFELIGEPIYDEASQLWRQEIQLRINQR
jgi:hypothetical protein